MKRIATLLTALLILASGLTVAAMVAAPAQACDNVGCVPPPPPPPEPCEGVGCPPPPDPCDQVGGCPPPPPCDYVGCTEPPPCEQVGCPGAAPVDAVAPVDVVGPIDVVGPEVVKTRGAGHKFKKARWPSAGLWLIRHR